jgi:pimeloyl-ACP methyl ester carboxylesterase
VHTTTVDGLTIAYEVVGDGGQPWILTPGGRFSKDYPGVRELAEAVAERGNQVVIWDRPNTGASDVVFDRTPESTIQADALAGLLVALDLGPAVLAGGSGGSRVAMLAAGRHPELCSALALWWISGGVLGLVGLGFHYCSDSIRAAWNGGMEAVVELAAWQEVLERNPANRERMLALDPQEFVTVLEGWMLTYCPCDDALVPGLSATEQAAITMPTLVFRSGASDVNHPRTTSERIAAALPDARLVEPPWGDREWLDRQAARAAGDGSLFERWPLLAPQLCDWAGEVLGR